jgi:hypothetical protein
VIPEKVDQAAHPRSAGSTGGDPSPTTQNCTKERNTVERCVNQIKAWRGLASAATSDLTATSPGSNCADRPSGSVASSRTHDHNPNTTWKPSVRRDHAQFVIRRYDLVRLGSCGGVIIAHIELTPHFYALTGHSGGAAGAARSAALERASPNQIGA